MSRVWNEDGGDAEAEGQPDADADAEALDARSVTERTEGTDNSDAIASNKRASGRDGGSVYKACSNREPHKWCGYKCVWCGGQSPLGHICASSGREARIASARRELRDGQRVG